MNLQVKALADGCGVTLDTVRHYTRLGLLRPRRDPGNGYKLFSPDDVTRLRFIKHAKALGFTLPEIKSILGHSARGMSPCPMVREIFSHRLAENRERLRLEMEWQRRMETEFARWQRMPDRVPNGHSICRLIESFDLSDKPVTAGAPRRKVKAL